MKAPDKIYIQTNKGEAFSSKWTTIPFRDFENTEYIKKDALLEWVRKLNETYHKEYELSRYTCGEHWGQMVAFQKVIDKLNEM